MVTQQQLWKDSSKSWCCSSSALVCFVLLSVQAMLRVAMETIFVFREMIRIKVRFGFVGFCHCWERVLLYKLG